MTNRERGGRKMAWLSPACLNSITAEPARDSEAIAPACMLLLKTLSVTLCAIRRFFAVQIGGTPFKNPKLEA